MKVYGEMRQEKIKIDDKINKLFTHPKVCRVDGIFVEKERL